jgi:hypothetical protein
MAVTHAGQAHVHRPRFNPWLAAVIGLAAALVALGAWVIFDQTRSSSSEGLASPEVATMLENRIAAFYRADGRAAAAFYTKDAVMQEEDIGLTTRGREQIAARLQYLMDAGLRMKTVGAPIQIGRFVGEAVRFYDPGGTARGEGVLAFELDQTSGKIVHQWVTAEVRG